jgi:hypothetical protein
MRVLALSAVCDRVAMVYLEDDRLHDWRTSRRAARSPLEMANYTQRIIATYQPDVLVTEQVLTHHKSVATRKLIAAAADQAADASDLLDVSIARERRYPNAFEEAKALAKAYPPALYWLPKRRRIFDPQPRVMVQFEALSLAHSIATGPVDGLNTTSG